ncbi:hypothetical protein [Nocardioides sp. T2.26MG-1]|uniref:hypothetical protein n=1 Tax=Nocardioides sp. T2.26MG-1 TaxID=3041166 RepID=UPI0024778A9C|nr:hypothetical protein [Nocardioides sp. T2.26MG-1]CAI9418604.1 hypothetical protein HIDPHFAB_03333 [Nocardioides sp. T2.26MG-1]
MVVIALMVVGGIVMVTLAAFALLRGWGTEVSRTEAELHEPDAHAEVVGVPPGQDPAVLMAALHGAGFVAIEETPERLLVGCPQPGDAERVRALVAHAHQH